MRSLLFASAAAAAAAGLEGGHLSSPSSSLRRVQQAPQQGLDSIEVVVPVCEPGYKDRTGGKAFHWSCAHHCEGGPNYATAQCQCACLTAEQIAELEATTTTTTSKEPPTTTSIPIASGSGTLIPTGGPATTPPPVTGVSGFPVGDLNSGGPRPGGPGRGSGGGTPAPDMEGNETAQEREQRDRTSVETVAAVGGAAIAGLCLLSLLILVCCGLRRRKQVSPETAPSITLYKPKEAAPEPSYEVTVPGRASSRASSKSSVGSNQFLIGGGSRKASRTSSKNSSGSSRSAGQATDLDDALANGGSSANVSGRNSISSWTWGQRNDRPSATHLTPQRSRGTGNQGLRPRLIGNQGPTNRKQAKHRQQALAGGARGWRHGAASK
ncbi:unnamed protein product [Symbiodinium sp. KB8]|nr:unnamed protein product [Symbiodinium sp. KB8]